jgi:hypothetical protein
MHVEQIFFAKDAQLSKSWKIVLHKETRGPRSKFTKETNIKIDMFDLGNNANYARLTIEI